MGFWMSLEERMEEQVATATEHETKAKRAAERESMREQQMRVEMARMARLGRERNVRVLAGQIAQSIRLQNVHLGVATRMQNLAMALRDAKSKADLQQMVVTTARLMKRLCDRHSDAELGTMLQQLKWSMSSLDLRQDMVDEMLEAEAEEADDEEADPDTAAGRIADLALDEAELARAEAAAAPPVARRASAKASRGGAVSRV